MNTAAGEGRANTKAEHELNTATKQGKGKTQHWNNRIETKTKFSRIKNSKGKGRNRSKAEQNSQTMSPKRSQRVQMNNHPNPEAQHQSKNREIANSTQTHEFFCRNQTEIELESINYKKFKSWNSKLTLTLILKFEEHNWNLRLD